MALLLVGVATVLPQYNAASQARSAQTNGPIQEAPMSTSTVPTTSTTSTSTASSHSSTRSGALAGSINAPVAGGQAAKASNSTTRSSSASETSSASANAYQGNGAPPVPNGVASSSQPSKPASLLTVLPGEGVGNLIATLSPLLIAILVALLVYAAYSRRQDSS